MLKHTGFKSIALLVCLFMAPFTGEAFAQSKKELLEAIQRLDSQVDQLYQMAEDKQGEERRILSDMAVQISSIEGQLRALTGRLEKSEYRYEQLLKRLDLFMADANLRFETLENPKTEAVEAADGADVTPAPTKETLTPPSSLVLPEGTPAEQYAWAYGFVRENKLEDAKKALNMVMERHSKDPVAANAHYWLGRVYLLEKNPALAAQQFLIVFESFPKHEKAQDSLVELGAALALLGDKEQACAAIEEFNRAYPDAKGRLKSRARDTAKSAGCAA